MKTLFEQKLEVINLEHIKNGGREPIFGFSFVGETSPEAELDIQTKFLLALMDINVLRL